jgi:hypothetical protein
VEAADKALADLRERRDAASEWCNVVITEESAVSKPSSYAGFLEGLRST